MAEGLVQCAIAILALCISFACADELPAEHQCPAAGSCQAVGREVPIIDIQALLNSGQHSSADWDKAAEEVAKACEEWGFFQAVNHGIPGSLLDGVVAKGREMFSMPKAEKSKFKRTATNARGWYDDELTKQTRDWKEGFDFGHVPDPDVPPDHPNNVVQDGYNQWPGDSVPSFKETMDTFYSSAAQVAGHLLKGVASHLGLSREHFGPSFEPHTSYLRLNYYPPCPEPSTFSVNRHTDAGALTVLLQENGTVALQVNHQRTGRWVSIPPVDGALTINVGDLLQVWTNDLLVAPEHRVLSQVNSDRFSAPFFYNPAYHANVAPLPLRRGRGKTPEADHELDRHRGGEAAAGEDGLEQQERPRYRPLNWGEFRQKRFAGDFADQGTEEVQISHYRL